MNILIATGIYPPAIGGPAKYAENIRAEWEKSGHRVMVKTYGLEHSLPSGIRHIFYFIKIIPTILRCDFILALDTFSVGWPATIAARLFRKRVIMRTGGDFLWEGYVERTRDLILLKDFYKTDKKRWSVKERMIFKITKWTLRHLSILIFSTNWQKNIWTDPYELAESKIKIVENYYGLKEKSFEPTRKDFIAGTRKLAWKNLDILEKIFNEIPEAILDMDNYPYDKYMNNISKCYASLLVSLGDISPNMILDTIRHDKPFIITEENGLMDRIKDIAITVNPKDPEDIKRKVLWLCEKENYEAQVQKIRSFRFTHTWSDIAQEILQLYKTL